MNVSVQRRLKKSTQKIKSPLALMLIIVLLSSCGKKPQKNDRTYYSQSVRATSHGDNKQALFFLDKAIARKPLAQYLALKGTIFYQAGQFGESKKLFERALKSKHLDASIAADIKNNYACVLNQLGKRSTAERIWKDLINNPQYRTPEVAWLNLGLRAWKDHGLLMQRKQAKKAKSAARVAMKRLDKAINLEPSYIDAIFFNAEIHAALNKKKTAKKLLNELLILSPEHTNARMLLGQL